MKKIIIVDDMSDMFKLILEAIRQNGARSEVVITDATPKPVTDPSIVIVGRTKTGGIVIIGHEDKIPLLTDLAGEDLRKKAETMMLAITREMPTVDLGDLKDFVVMPKPKPQYLRQDKLPAKFRGKNSQFSRRRH